MLGIVKIEKLIFQENGSFENLGLAVKEVLDQSGLLLWCLASCLACLGLNWFGSELTKRVSCIYRTFVNSLSPIGIWVSSKAVI